MTTKEVETITFYKPSLWKILLNSTGLRPIYPHDVLSAVGLKQISHLYSDFYGDHYRFETDVDGGCADWRRDKKWYTSLPHDLGRSGAKIVWSAHKMKS